MKDYFELGDGGAPQTAPILVEVAEDFDCTTLREFSRIQIIVAGATNNST